MTISDLSAKPGARKRKVARDEATERRVSDRVILSLAAELIESQAGAKISGRMSDCCMFGCFVDTINTFPDKTTVRLRLRKGAEMFEAEAIVAYSQVRLGMGLAFTYISQENRRMLESWIAGASDKPIHGMAAAARDPEHREQPIQSKRFERLVRLLAEKGILRDADARELLGGPLL
jgi:hypothetical protein